MKSSPNLHSERAFLLPPRDRSRSPLTLPRDRSSIFSSLESVSEIETFRNEARSVRSKNSDDVRRDCGDEEITISRRFLMSIMNNSFLCFGSAYLFVIGVMFCVGLLNVNQNGPSFRSSTVTIPPDEDLSVIAITTTSQQPSRIFATTTKDVVVTDESVSRWEDFKDLLVEFHLLQQQKNLPQKQQQGDADGSRVDIRAVASLYDLKGAEWIHNQRERVKRWWQDAIRDETLKEKSIMQHLQKHEEYVESVDDEWSGIVPLLSQSLLSVSPTSLLYLNSSLAYSLLVDNGGNDDYDYSSDYFLLEGGLDAQINQAYCGVASSVAVLNSFRDRLPQSTSLTIDPIYDPYPYMTQQDIFNDCTNQHVIHHNKDFDGVLTAPGGLTLDMVNTLLQCQFSSPPINTNETNMSSVINSTVHHVDPAITSMEEMKRDIMDALKNPLSRVIINYDRKRAGQMGGGHFSPIGAYSPKRDAFLILDVAKYKYPPLWIPTRNLYQSLATIDVCGTWNYPMGQDQLTTDEINSWASNDPGWRYSYLDALQSLNCQPAYRGYIIVTLNEGQTNKRAI